MSADLDSIKSCLEFLYGDAAASSLLGRVRRLIDGHRENAPTAPVPRNPLPLSEKDALLITYGDQVREPGIPPLQTLGAFCRDHLRDVVSGIHVLPFYPYSSDDGFSVIDYHAVDPALGTWDDVRHLGHEFDLMFDAVFNHISARSEWFQKFLQDDPSYRDFFITVGGAPDLSQVVRPRALPLLTLVRTAAGEKMVWTTFSADQIDVNARNPEVMLELLEVLLFYVRQGARFIRLDAIAYLWKEIGTPCIHLPQTHRLIQLMRSVLDEAAPETLLITETNVPHAENVSYFGDGTNEAQLVYNFALPPLVLHALLTGHGAHLSRWAAGLTSPSQQVTFFNFLASHDGIGVNPARGILSESEIESVLIQTVLARGGYVSYKTNPNGSRSPYELNINYFDALSDPGDAAESREIKVRRFLVAQSIMLTLAGMPGIYFHSLFGSRNDRAGAEASGIPRRINRQKLERQGLEEDLASPQSTRGKVFTGFKKLLAARRACPAFAPTATQTILDGPAGVFGLVRFAASVGQRAICLHNLTSRPTIATYAMRKTPDTRWEPLIADDSEGGTDWLEAELRVRLAPYATVWIREFPPKP